VKLKPLRCMVCNNDIVVGQFANIVVEDNTIIGVVHTRRGDKRGKTCADVVIDQYSGASK